MILIYEHDHLHLWHDSPLWAVAFLRSKSCQLFLLWISWQQNFYKVGPSTPRPTWRTRPPYLWPQRQVTQLYPQALGTHFSLLLWHAWATLGLFLSSSHHTELIKMSAQNDVFNTEKYLPSILYESNFSYFHAGKIMKSFNHKFHGNVILKWNCCKSKKSVVQLGCQVIFD
jgi:hypothetical protein